MLDLLIRGGTVIDGTGKPGFAADVGVAGGRVAAVQPGLEAEAARTIDAAGLCVTPGFIDPHTHSDVPLLVDPKAQSKIRQGVTTEVVGNCGSSPAPLVGQALEEAQRRCALLELEVTWRSFGEYLERLRGPGTAVNVVPLVGHNTVRGSVMGYGEGAPTAAQQAEMEEQVARAMEEGAAGLSTGLYYPPGYYAGLDEVVGLARVAQRHGGVYASHIRSESDGLIEAVEEAIEIGRQAEIRVQIAHLKASGYRNWHKVDALVETLEKGAAAGVALGCDQYPYAASSTWLAAILPYWAQAGGGRQIAARLSDPAARERLRQDYQTHRAEWDDRSGVRDWSDILISDCAARPEVLGLTVAEVAARDGKDPFDAALDLMVQAEAQVSCVWFSQSEEVVRRLMAHPLVVVGSDGSCLAAEGPLGRRQAHPRNYGTFVRVLGQYARQDRVLTLEEGVRKMTSETAARFGLSGRGVLEPGAWADVAVFDPQTVGDRATYRDPHQYAAGVPYVLVNGQVVVDGGRHTGALPGQVLWTAARDAPSAARDAPSAAPATHPSRGEDPDGRRGAGCTTR
ncbi:MAG: D-aminoacylase [Gemmatimonadota bacterium]